jgi:hypothetical protein
MSTTVAADAKVRAPARVARRRTGETTPHR